MAARMEYLRCRLHDIDKQVNGLHETILMVEIIVPHAVNNGTKKTGHLPLSVFFWDLPGWIGLFLSS
jgi:hypothetical protein